MLREAISREVVMDGYDMLYHLLKQAMIPLTLFFLEGGFGLWLFHSNRQMVCGAWCIVHGEERRMA